MGIRVLPGMGKWKTNMPSSGDDDGQTATVGKGYLSEWNKIAGEAEKEFHTPTPMPAPYYIFPRDSR